LDSFNACLGTGFDRITSGLTTMLSAGVFAAHDEAHLHFEHVPCPVVSFCDASGHLHQTYKLGGGHYRLLKSFRGPASD
jgi:hypothetical protein